MPNMRSKPTVASTSRPPEGVDSFDPRPQSVSNSPLGKCPGIPGAARSEQFDSTKDYTAGNRGTGPSGVPNTAASMKARDSRPAEVDKNFNVRP